MTADFDRQGCGRAPHRGFDLGREGAPWRRRRVGDFHTVSHDAGRQNSQSPTEGERGSHSEAVGREQRRGPAECLFVEPVQSPRWSPRASGIDQNQQVGPRPERQQAHPRPVGHSGRNPCSLLGRKEGRAFQGLYDTPADLVVTEGRTDAEDADDVQERWMRRSRKWVAQEMQGS
jgi:hypothetical protein